MTTTIEEDNLGENSPVYEGPTEEDVNLALQDCSDTVGAIAVSAADDFMEVPWLKKNS